MPSEAEPGVDFPMVAAPARWPWVGGATSERAGERAVRGLPRITVVTPSFNQAAFLEETIRSVLLQGYPNLEYLVVDGGSTDGSVEILEKYSPWIDWWVSERDRGQADALNKGFRRATGEILAFLNSDDVYEPGTLRRVASDFAESGPGAWHCYPVLEFWPDGSERLQTCPWLSEKVDRYAALPAARDLLFDGESVRVRELAAWLLECVRGHQPGTFWGAEAFHRVGGFDERMHYGFDQKLFWELMARGYHPVMHEGPPAARFRWHASSKSQTADAEGANRFASELREAALEFLPRLPRRGRELVRSEYLRHAVSTTWQDFRRSGRRGDALRSLAAVWRRVPSAIGDRYFAGSLLRFLTMGRR